MESCPYSLIEAMALGKPVVASSVPGIQDMVSDGESALLVPPGNPKALASAMQRILDDPSLGRKLGSAAAEQATQRFSLARMCQETEQYFEQVLAAS
jgi:glycosyltransferase involved in cell wall biosynthesis